MSGDGRVLVLENGTLPLDGGDLKIILDKAVLVAAGEYADQGAPDILIHVVHAVHYDGVDIKMDVAKLIADAVGPLADSIAQCIEATADTLDEALDDD